MIAAAALFLIALLGAGAASAAEIPLAERKSGYEFMGRETRAMQDDDTANPAMLSVLDGETLWQRKDGSAAKSCADCHGDARTSIGGLGDPRRGATEPRGSPVNRGPGDSGLRGSHLDSGGCGREGADGARDGTGAGPRGRKNRQRCRSHKSRGLSPIERRETEEKREEKVKVSTTTVRRGQSSALAFLGFLRCFLRCHGGV